MLGSIFSSSRSALSPQKELELANFYLENARKTVDPEIALALCDDAKYSLSRMKRAAKKTLLSSSSVEDPALPLKIAAAYLEHSAQLVRLGYKESAQTSYKKAKKWRYVHDQGPPSTGYAIVPATSLAAHDRDIAQIPSEIFSQNVTRPAAKHDLPKKYEHIASTPQLVYCLSLLSKAMSSSSSSSSMVVLDETLDKTQCAWVQARMEDADEQERLRSLAKKLVAAFIDDQLRDPTTVAEVAYLAPVLEQEHYRRLLCTFVHDIDQSALLDFNLLEGLAQLIQNASPQYLPASDLVKILQVLSRRVYDIFQQSTDHIFQLVLAVSHVLDAMADSHVEGLNREQLRQPLSTYLNRLKDSPDPYLVYQAAYAYQALKHVPDDETPWQAVLRRTGYVVIGIAGLTSAVKTLDLIGFIDGLKLLQAELQAGSTAFTELLEHLSSLVESGQGFLEILKGDFSISKKQAWYPALRGADTLLRDGRLAEFKMLVCFAPCRRDPAFQWGLCQRLGEIAANQVWDAGIRQSAVDFLGELYKNDTDWGKQADIKQWILTILIQLADSLDSATKSHANTLLLELETNGDAEKQALYQACRSRPPKRYPVNICLPAPASPSLLDRVQDIPDVEYDLRRLREQRLKARSNAVYIPPQAKPSPQAPDSPLFSLMENVQEFLRGERQVLLLLGDSGAGKSTFNQALECDLWNRYKKKEDPIPLYINLPAIDKPEQDMITKHLRRNDFTEPQIREMKGHRKLILICDGYDESQQIHNLYTSNKLNQEGQWCAKMVISCRSEYLPNDYRDRFQPTDGNHTAASGLFQEAVIAPFSKCQIKEYIKQYVFASRPLWATRDYLEALDKIPNLWDLVKNPFLLTLSLEVLPRMVDPGQNLSTTWVTRVALYDHFVEQWLERGKKRLVEKKDLSRQERKAFQRLSDEGFTQNGTTFLKELAAAIYKQQGGHPVVEYSQLRDKGTWKEAFFCQDDAKEHLREACPLSRSGNQYRFIHRSLLEYGLVRAVFEPQGGKILSQTPTLARQGSDNSMFSFEDRTAPEEESVGIQQLLVDHPLTWRSFVGEPSILQFLEERVQQEPLFKQQLLAMIERSKVDREARKAAANAITILVRAGMRFNGADLKDIQIPGADLSYGEFDSAQLQGSDLRKANLRNIWLRHANLSNSQMAGVQFGEWPYLVEFGEVHSCAYSPDGKTCAVGLGDGSISVYDTSTWEKTHILRGHASDVASIVYSPSAERIASGSWDKTVRLWNAKTGTPGPILSGHTNHVRSVAYSPCGEQIASGSWDNTVRLWNAQTGEPRHILSGHTALVTIVAYSPHGQQIASGSWDRTVRLWDAETGEPRHILSGHTDHVTSVAYSPCGQQIASGSWDGRVRLWDAETGEPRHILSGHTDHVTSVACSPSDQQVTSGSWDRTVRLWDAETGELRHTLSGHTDHVTIVMYSPSGLQIASGSDDRTVRLWDAESGEPSHILSGHAKRVSSVVYSPCSQQIASGSDDNTVRLWDAQTSAPGPTLRGHTSYVGSVVCSPSYKQIASGSDDKTVRLWDSETGAPDHILYGHTSGVMSVVYSPSGEQIASGSDDNTVRLWDAQTGAPGHILCGHTNYVRSVAYSPCGEQIASGSWDNTVRLWNAQTGMCRHIISGHTDLVTSVAYSPCGQQIASCSQDKTVRLWYAQTGEPRHILSGHTDHVTSVAYSPCGQQIASGSWDRTVRLWDAATSEPSHILSGHTDHVTSIAYSPCDQLIASGSDDNKVRLWDVTSGRCWAVVEGFDGRITSIAWNKTPNGMSFATGCSDKSVSMWRIKKGEDGYQVRLHWTTMHDRLAVWKTSIQSVHGLSGINKQLLKQRGAVGKPTLPLGLHEAST